MTQETLGKCIFCKAEYPKDEMAVHLRSRQPTEGNQQTLHLLAEGLHAPKYWIHFDIPLDAELATLDKFFREVWLECCHDHPSAFSIKQVSYKSDSVKEGWLDSRDMHVALGHILEPSDIFTYDYDFGGITTELKITVIAQHEGEAFDEPKLMARNNAPIFACSECGKPAVAVCSECVYEQTGLLCEEHAKTHKCQDKVLPIVNSPRTGKCCFKGTENGSQYAIV